MLRIRVKSVGDLRRVTLYKIQQKNSWRNQLEDKSSTERRLIVGICGEEIEIGGYNLVDSFILLL